MKRYYLNILILLSLRGLFDCCYVYYIVPVHGYIGFAFIPDTFKYTVSWLIFLLVLPITPTRLNKVSDVVFILVITSIIAPLTSMYGLSGENIVPVLMTVISMLIIFVIANAKSIATVRIPHFKHGEHFAILISIMIILIVAIHYLHSGVHLNLDLKLVYKYRSANAEVAGRGIFSYLNGWAFMVFSLFLLAIFLNRKLYLFSMLMLCVQVFFYAASQHKSVLFSPLFVLGVWWYFRRNRNLLIIPVSILFLLLVSLLTFLFEYRNILPSLVIHRVFFLPAKLTFDYYSFFTGNPYLLWSESFWMPLQSPYSDAIVRIIGDYAGTPGANANNGYISSGFAQAGFLGVLLYTMLLGIVIRFVDSKSVQLRSTWLGVALFLPPFISIWQSCDLLTGLLTGGLLIMLLLLLLLRGSTRYPEVMFHMASRLAAK